MQNIDLTENWLNITKHSNLLSYVKMGKEILTFGDTEIEKHKFYHYKSPTFLLDVDIENILVSNNISSVVKNL